MNRTLPTSFRGSRRLQQPKPLSTPPLSASTATHNTNLYGTIGFLGRQSIAIQNRFLVARASLVEEESAGEETRELANEFDTSGRLAKWVGRSSWEWEGVVCDNATTRVTQILLPSSITGVFNTAQKGSLGRLNSIHSLDLSFNELASNLPEVLAKLTLLESLKLQREIPKGKSLIDFPESTYSGNEGLCGKPISACKL
ncbi:hypothetical protein DEO72_LG4g1486 [Vigna unguiculata]|uniref:LRR receptor-like serine/threonine-protein kinase FLS2 n=1 Tax=Vigna unguiculata TaxID=3917 RepID=A0A4D6LPT5_VIGUN|nr:hypothetical protein DEO72_LG4g1486 [Vigna unguiculata]